MDRAPLTVVIPVYNRAHTLGRTLRSLDAQTVAPEAVVLVDNASTDSSMQLMREWAEGKSWVKIVSESTPGACHARNRGLREVKTEWTMFFDSDDEMLPRHIADFAREIRLNPDADILGRDIIAEKDGAPRRLYFSSVSPLFNHIFRGSLSTQRYIARTRLFRECGGWNSGLPAWNDYELGFRLLLRSPHIATVPGSPSVITHFTPDSLTGADFASRHDQWEGALAEMRREAIEADHRDLLKWLDARAMVLAAIYYREGAVEHAHRLHDEVMARASSPRRQHLIYLYQTRIPRLAWLLARIIL